MHDLLDWLSYPLVGRSGRNLERAAGPAQPAALVAISRSWIDGRDPPGASARPDDRGRPPATACLAPKSSRGRDGPAASVERTEAARGFRAARARSGPRAFRYCDPTRLTASGSTNPHAGLARSVPDQRSADSVTAGLPPP